MTVEILEIVLNLSNPALSIYVLLSPMLIITGPRWTPDFNVSQMIYSYCLQVSMSAILQSYLLTAECCQYFLVI